MTKKFRAGKPPTGLHLDVTKDTKLIQVIFVKLQCSKNQLIMN